VYPKDNTPGCTAEACAFRDSYEIFTEAGAEVIGISHRPARQRRAGDRPAASDGTARLKLPGTVVSG
jgi:peroxiredoxin Q/BCP